MTGALINFLCENKGFQGAQPTNTGAPIEWIDLSNCHALKEITCGGSLIRELDFRHMPYFVYLCANECTNLTSILLPKSFGEIDGESYLLEGTPIKSFDCSNRPNVEYLYIDGCTAIQSLDISVCGKLNYFFAEDVKTLTDIKTTTTFASNWPIQSLVTAIKASTATGTKTLTLYGNGQYKSALKTAGTSAGWTVKEAN